MRLSLFLDVDDLFAEHAVWRVYRMMGHFVWIVSRLFENVFQDVEIMSSHARRSNKRTDIICFALLAFFVTHHYTTTLRFHTLYCMQKP